MATTGPVMEESGVTYEELLDLEMEFDEVEKEIIRRQEKLNEPLYQKRQNLALKIANFWPLVFEQAPEDINKVIGPTDSQLLMSSLTSLFVSHFELEDGDPRSIVIRMEFAENGYLEDRVLEKRFWYRRADDGPDSWEGLVSEPVEIHWKEGKDLTGGLLGMAKKAWDEEKEAETTAAATTAAKTDGLDNEKNKKGGSKKDLTPAQQALKDKIKKTGIGGISFFAWFGWVGRRISAEESRIATEKDAERLRLRREGKPIPSGEDDDGGEEDDEEGSDGKDEDDLEIFTDGDELAIAISDDLWPGAIKYFTQAMELGDVSDSDFESDEDEGACYPIFMPD